MSTWIFLRGLTRDSRHWGDFPAHFGAEVENADVVMVDLPGNGALNHVPSPASVAAMADHCRGELLARGLRPPYHLLAMSLGAMVAVAWAEQHPEELGSCVLINTSLRPFSPFYRRLRPGNYPALLWLALAANVDAREAAILRLTSRLAKDRERIAASWSEWQRERPVSRANALRQLWAASRYRAPLTAPALPLLVLAGAGDELVNPVCSRQLAEHWRTGYAEHPAAGHDLPLDDGKWLTRQVRDWLSRIRQASR